MPGGDGTGPMGFGPMTGRAAGFCAGGQTSGFLNGMPGRRFGLGFAGGRGFGFGFGCGGGWGRRNMFYATGATGWQRAATGFSRFNETETAPYNAPITPQQELDALKAQSESFTHALEKIRKRMDELQTANK